MVVQLNISILNGIKQSASKFMMHTYLHLHLHLHFLPTNLNVKWSAEIKKKHKHTKQSENFETQSAFIAHRENVKCMHANSSWNSVFSLYRYFCVVCVCVVGANVISRAIIASAKWPICFTMYMYMLMHFTRSPAV